MSLMKGPRPLRVLSLRSVRLQDEGCARLCGTLSLACPSLVELLMPQNELQHCGDALGDLVASHKHLSNLDLHWNHIDGPSGAALFKGLEQSRLRRLDLSFNRLHSRADPPDLRCPEAIAELFRENTRLFHLSLAYNLLDADECTIFAQARPER